MDTLHTERRVKHTLRVGVSRKVRERGGDEGAGGDSGKWNSLHHCKCETSHR